jgi:hypothetical protein
MMGCRPLASACRGGDANELGTAGGGDAPVERVLHHVLDVDVIGRGVQVGLPEEAGCPHAQALHATGRARANHTGQSCLLVRDGQGVER